jgi:hypothetical protein
LESIKNIICKFVNRVNENGKEKGLELNYDYNPEMMDNDKVMKLMNVYIDDIFKEKVTQDQVDNFQLILPKYKIYYHLILYAGMYAVVMNCTDQEAIDTTLENLLKFPLEEEDCKETIVNGNQAASVTEFVKVALGNLLDFIMNCGVRPEPKYCPTKKN